MQLRSGVAVAVAQTSGYSSNSTLAWEPPCAADVALKDKKKKKKQKNTETDSQTWKTLWLPKETGLRERMGWGFGVEM